METWKDARFDSFYYDAAADTNESCEVILNDGELTISYWDDDIKGPAIYKGREVAPGHFELTAPMLNGRATLHRLPDAVLLVGSWVEDGERGMWQIELM
jgi:hypothetical protein